MSATVQPADIEAQIRALLNKEISLNARLNAFLMVMNETLGRIRQDIDAAQTERLRLEDKRIAAVDAKYEGAPE